MKSVEATFEVRLFRREWDAFAEYCKLMGSGDPRSVCEQAAQEYFVNVSGFDPREEPEAFTKRSKEYWLLFKRLFKLLGSALAISLGAALTTSIEAGGLLLLQRVSVWVVVLSLGLAGGAYLLATLLNENRTGGGSPQVVEFFRRLEMAWLWAWTLLVLAMFLTVPIAIALLLNPSIS
jgi:hypothetical protein